MARSVCLVRVCLIVGSPLVERKTSIYFGIGIAWRI
jgi:hypothetical protein